jgi:uncharacterized membrane protein required for colicin V production
MNWLLIAVVGILAINTLIGLKTGFIRMVFSLCSLVLALILTVWISPLVNDFMRGNEKFYNGISDKVEKMLPLEKETKQVNDQVSYIEGLKLPQSIKDTLIVNNNSDVYKALSITNFREYLSNYITGIIINALSFIATFLVLLILLWALCLTLDIVSKLPLINQVNKTAGLLAGLIHGLIVVWLFFILITVFGSTELGQKALQMIGDNEFLSLIYNNNFLLGFITSATKMFL